MSNCHFNGIFEPFFTCDLEESVYDSKEWTLDRSAVISEGGKVLYKESDIEAPIDWSDSAVNIVATKYFAGSSDSDDREKSVWSLISRVSNTITDWGVKQGYFGEEDGDIFAMELSYILLHQMASFNSPVWFNVGVEKDPQCSACFILDVEDDMESILDWYRQEAMLFKFGSGSGVNISKLRGSKEKLSTGGTASGPLSFMKAADASAGVIKSGGKTRRSAKMVVLNVDHPDIMDFINCKVKEEKKARALMDAGYDRVMDGEAYEACAYQNSNHAVRLTDDFMSACRKYEDWDLKSVKTGKNYATIPAVDILGAIADAVHKCGDPGIQFHDAVNRFHTTPKCGEIVASNPCSEYVQINNSACNLSSIKLTAFWDGKSFDYKKFEHVVRMMTTAQDILINMASYPTEKIKKNATELRAIGLGYSDLGALIMSRGLPYDSPDARDIAAKITAFMTGAAYDQSARLANVLGPFAEYENNRDAMDSVIDTHAMKAFNFMNEDVNRVWKSAQRNENGFRNCQTTLLAPTGTISFMMDCDTTGIEPELALVKYKTLSGGGSFKIVNQSVEQALKALNYDDQRISSIIEYIREHETVGGCDLIKKSDREVFTCAFQAPRGSATLLPEAHIDMMSVVQPFLSGAISKTVNLSHDITVSDVENLIFYAWNKKLKGVTFYRDGCKAIQPLNVKAEKKEVENEIKIEMNEENKPVRNRLPLTCNSKRHKFNIGGQEGYIHTGYYDNGNIGEVFIRMSKEGSTLNGVMDALGTTTSMALQYGVPLEDMVKKFSHMRFEPAGFTDNADIPMAKSIIDYVFRYLGIIGLPEDKIQEMGLKNGNGHNVEKKTDVVSVSESSSICPDCGSIMQRHGTCYACRDCGTTTGCS